MNVFSGIDLAWSSNNLSGVCDLSLKENNRLVISNLFLAKSLEEIYDGVKGEIISVDASLLVNNESGMRDCEYEIAKDFRKFGCGVYPTNKKILSKIGFRGEEVANYYSSKGFSLNPLFGGKKVIEIYTHAALIGMFNLDAHMKYKAKPKRSVEFRKAELKRLQSFLKTYIDSSFLSEPIPEKGKALKGFEDKLDAVVCALTSYFVYNYPDKCKVYGKENGLIISPIPKVILDESL